MKKHLSSLLFNVICLLLIFAVLLYSDTFIKRQIVKKYSESVEKYALEYSLDPNFVYAIISTESSFRPNVMSKAGACGLMQLMPETASRLNKTYKLGIDETNLFDVDTNIHLGCCYLRFLFDLFDNTDLVICSYNAGEQNVKEWLEKYSSDGKTLNKIPYKETSNYLRKVKTRYEIYKILYN